MRYSILFFYGENQCNKVFDKKRGENDEKMVQGDHGIGVCRRICIGDITDRKR